MEITAEVLSQTDARTGKPLVDAIVDEAEQKGTGRWTVKSRWTSGPGDRHRRGRVRPRVGSGSAAPRGTGHGVRTSRPGKPTGCKGFHRGRPQRPCTRRRSSPTRRASNQIQAGSAEYNWGHHPGDLATIWRGGCIIRAKFLNRIKEAFDENPDLPTPARRTVLPGRHRGRHRQLASGGGDRHRTGHPNPGFSSALSQYDGCAPSACPPALTQGLRDLFGAHTYGRIDTDHAKRFHTLWSATHRVSRLISPASRRKGPEVRQKKGPLRLLGGRVAGHTRLGEKASPRSSTAVTT